jgi:hypothetical protein
VPTTLSRKRDRTAGRRDSGREMLRRSGINTDVVAR